MELSEKIAKSQEVSNYTQATHGVTFGYDDLFGLKHLRVGPLHHITLSLIQF